MKRLLAAVLATVMVLAWCVAAWAGDRPLALLYDGRGAAEDAAEDMASVLEDLGYEVRYFYEPEELLDLPDGTALLAIGGTEDDIRGLRKSFTPEVVAAMREFVNNGGTYLGICGGAYLASAGWEERSGNGDLVWMDGFGLMDVETDTYGETMDPMLLPVAWRENPWEMYYQGGPMFTPLGDVPGWDVVARYPQRGEDNEPPVAAVAGGHGRGRVLLIGPHSEATEDWLDEDGLDHGDWRPTRGLLKEELEKLRPGS